MAFVNLFTTTTTTTTATTSTDDNDDSDTEETVCKASVIVNRCLIKCNKENCAVKKKSAV